MRPSAWSALGPATPPAPTPAAPGRERLIRVLTLAALVTVALLVARWLLSAGRIIAYPYEWSTMDGYYVSYAQRLFEGRPIYSDHRVAPMGYLYVPGYLVVLGPLVRLFGPAVWVDRAIALLSTLGLAAVGGHVVRRSTGSVGWGLLAAGLCVAPPVVGQWYLVRGQDPFVWFLGLCATALLAEARQVSPRLVVGTAVLYVFAFFCKQTALFPWIAGAAVLCVRAPGRLPSFLGTSLGLGLAVGFGVEAWSGGWFWENTFASMARHPYYVRLLFNNLMGFLPFVGSVLIAAGLLAGWQFRPGGGQPWRDREALPWGLYWAALLSSGALAGKIGSAPVYFIPAYIASVILACQLAPRWLAARPSVRATVAVLALVQTAWWGAHPLRTPTADAERRSRQLLNAIVAHPGRILTEQADSFATLAGREVECEAPQVEIMAKVEGWALEALLADLREQRIGAVLYSGKYFYSLYWLRRTIFTYYTPLEGAEAIPISLFYGEEVYTLLVPKPAEKLPATPLLPPEDAPAETLN